MASIEQIMGINKLFSSGAKQIGISLVQERFELKDSEEAVTLLTAFYKKYHKKMIGIFLLTLFQGGKLVKKIISSNSNQKFEPDTIESCLLIGVERKEKNKMESEEDKKVDYSSFSLVKISKEEEFRNNSIIEKSGGKSGNKRNGQSINGSGSKDLKKVKPNQQSKKKSRNLNSFFQPKKEVPKKKKVSKPSSLMSFFKKA